MARRPRASRLETRTARLKLTVREKPYEFTPISPGIALGYRRNGAAGTGSRAPPTAKVANWTKRAAIADDFEKTYGEHVLDLVAGERPGLASFEDAGRCPRARPDARTSHKFVGRPWSR